MVTNYWRKAVTLAATLTASSLACSAASGAQPYQSLDSIVAAAATASESRANKEGYDNVSVEVRPLDKRLRLRQCQQALATFAPQATQVLGSVSMGIRCSDANPWTIYVRTQVTAQRSVPVLTRALPRYALIGPEDIKLVERPLQSAANGLVYDPTQLIGKELTRQLDAGATIRVNQLRSPNAIKRGQQVTIVSGLKGLEVRNQGKAMKDAVEGARVTVTNLSSGKNIEGIARSDGTVSVQ
ncbi:MAG: flagellar basal body P-ring formation chaperone FlgA [Halioglobus sp.]